MIWNAFQVMTDILAYGSTCISTKYTVLLDLVSEGQNIIILFITRIHQSNYDFSPHSTLATLKTPT